MLKRIQWVKVSCLVEVNLRRIKSCKIIIKVLKWDEIELVQMYILAGLWLCMPSTLSLIKISSGVHSGRFMVVHAEHFIRD